MNQQLSDKKFLHNLINSEYIIFYVRYFLTILLNAFLIFYLEYAHKDFTILPEAFKDINNSFNLIYSNKVRFFIYLILSALIYFFMILEIIICYYNNKIKTPNQKESRSLMQKSNILMRQMEFTNIFFLLLNISAFFVPWIWSLVLLDILNKSPTMRDIIRSITLNYKQLLKTVLLTIIILYIYSFVAFSYFPQDFKHDESQDYKNYCNTLFMCFLSTLFNGIRSDGGIGDALGNLSRNSHHYWFRLLFDLSFFILVSICLMNIVFGTIIDSFAALRDKRKETINLIHNKCFICELEKHEIESKAEGWYEHI